MALAELDGLFVNEDGALEDLVDAYIGFIGDDGSRAAALMELEKSKWKFVSAFLQRARTVHELKQLVRRRPDGGAPTATADLASAAKALLDELF